LSAKATILIEDAVTADNVNAFISLQARGALKGASILLVGFLCKLFDLLEVEAVLNCERELVKILVMTVSPYLGDLFGCGYLIHSQQVKELIMFSAVGNFFKNGGNTWM